MGSGEEPVMGIDDGKLFDAVGFSWDRTSFAPDPEVQPVKVVIFRYRKALAGVVWHDAQLEGNPFTFAEVQTLMDGITVGGHKVSDESQIRGLIDSSRFLADRVEHGEFALTKAMSDRLHAILAREEAFDAGQFRGEGEIVTNVSVALGEYGIYEPLASIRGAVNLRAQYARALAAIAHISSPVERALAYNAFGCRAQLYYDANKRISRHMMNGELMSHGFDAISIPAARRAEYNQLMVDLYRLGEATELFAFLADCRLP